MLDTLLQPSVVTRLLHLLQAAQPFLTPSWNRLADLCIRFLSISDLFFNPRRHDFPRLLQEVRNCSPSNDMHALLCAIRPFCSEEELQMLQLYEQFQQMQKAMDMWKIFSDLMPDINPFDSNPFDPETVRNESEDTLNPSVESAPHSESLSESTFHPLLSFLSPEQLALYNDILSDNSDS